MTQMNDKDVDIKAAALSEFSSPRSTILCGQALTDVKHIERSIIQFGLLSPLIVSQTRSGLIVIDGKKRFAAIKRLSFKGDLPSSITHIPYVLIEDAKTSSIRVTSNLSIRTFYKAVTTLKSQGHSIDSIANQLYLCRSSVTDFIRLSYLCLPIRNALFNNLISFDQAQAYTVIPDAEVQTAVMKDLGRFAKPSDILEAMEALRCVYDVNMERKPTPSSEVAEFILSPNDIVTVPYGDRHYVWADAA